MTSPVEPAHSRPRIPSQGTAAFLFVPDSAAHTDPAARTDPAVRTDSAARTDPAARTDYRSASDRSARQPGGPVPTAQRPTELSDLYARIGR